MKTRIILLISSAFFISSISAQSLKVGLNFANITTTNDGDIDDSKMLTSFHAGFSGNIKVATILYFQPGILVTGKGAKTQSGSTADANYYRATSNPLYVEIPANFVLKTPTGNVKLFAGAGPYIAVGVAGNNKVDGKFLGTSFSSTENIRWSDDDPSTLNYEEGSGYGIMKRFDYGLNAIAGLETKNATLSVNYGHGLAKLQSGSNSSADDKNKHRVLSLSIGFKL
jgi:Outer membrane protein beta-barrel domain